MCTQIFPCITDVIPALQLFLTVSCCLSIRALQLTTSERKKQTNSERASSSSSGPSEPEADRRAGEAGNV